MKITLTPEQEEWLKSEIAKGGFATPEDVIRHAINEARRNRFRDNFAGALARRTQDAQRRIPQRLPSEKLRRLREIAERSAARPVLDGRSADDIIGYDEQGLPR